MTWYWSIAFVALGWVLCWRYSNLLLRKVFRKPDKMLREAIERLPQKSLIAVRDYAQAEIDARRKGAIESEAT